MEQKQVEKMTSDSLSNENKALKVETFPQYIAGQFDLINKDLLRYGLTGLNVALPTDILPKQVGEFIDNQLEQNKKETLDLQERLDEYVGDPNSFRGAIINVAGGAVRGLADPINFMLGKMTPQGVLANAFVDMSTNLAQYAFDQSSLYDRNIFTDFKPEQDIPSLASQAGFVALGGIVGKRANKYLEGIPEQDIFMTRKDTTGQKVEDVPLKDLGEIFKKYGVDTTDKKALFDDLSIVSNAIETLKRTDIDDVTAQNMREVLNNKENLYKLLQDEKLGFDFEAIRKKASEAIKKTGEEIPEDTEYRPQTFKDYEKFSPIDNIDDKLDVVHNNRDFTKTELKEQLVKDLEIPEEAKILSVNGNIPKRRIDKTIIEQERGAQQIKRTGGTWERDNPISDIVYEYKGQKYLIKSTFENGKWQGEGYKIKGMESSPLETFVKTSKILESGTYTVPELNLGSSAEIGKRMSFDRPQGNYRYNSVDDDIFNFVRQITEFDTEYKAQKFQQGKTDLNIKQQANLFIQPLIKNIRLAIDQLESADAEELFGSVKNTKRFGNQLYDLSQSINPFKFIDMLQGRIDLNSDDTLAEISRLMEQGKVKDAQQLEQTLNFQKLMKKKLNEFIKVKAGLEETPDIEQAYYLNTLYNKQNYMSRLYEAFTKDNKQWYDFFGTFLADEITLTKEQAKSVDSTLAKRGIASRIKTEGTYKFKDYSRELLTAFWHDINSTTKEAQKKGGTWGEAMSLQEVANKWGKEIDNMTKLGALAETFRGTERAPYEIVSNIYSTIAKEKLGLESINNLKKDLISDTQEINLSEFSNGIKALDSDVRSYVQKQIEGLSFGGEIEGRYKPNLNIDPQTQRFNNGHLRTATKSFFGYKFLANLNYLKEFSGNNLRIIEGAKKLGWKKRFSIFNSLIKDPILLHKDLAKVMGDIKKRNTDNIKDPILRRKAEIFIEKRVANDPIFNNPEGLSALGKATSKVESFLHKSGNIGGLGQTISDVHRTFNSEWATVNFMRDIFPNKEFDDLTPFLKNLLEGNGIDREYYDTVKLALKTYSEGEFYNLVWGGKRANTDMGIKVQNLYEQLSNVLGKEFDFIEDPTSKPSRFDFVNDMIFLYKRYSLGMFTQFTRDVMNVYGNSGYLERRFKWEGNSTQTMKRVFKGANVGQLVNFTCASASTTLLSYGIAYATGKVTGSSEDDVASAKLQALVQGDVFPLLTDAMYDFTMDKTGAGILFGGSTVLGGFSGNLISRAKRATSSYDLDPLEKIAYYTATLVTPETVARGIDNIKFGKSIPSRLTTSSSVANDLWKYQYKLNAQMEQLEGELPIEKVLPYINPINWVQYFTRNPEQAYAITQADPNHDKKAVILGASGMVEMLEQQTEQSAIAEITTDKDISDTQKEYKLKTMGLDIGTQLSKLDKQEKNTLAVIASFYDITDPNEMLQLTYELANTKKSDRKEFLRNLITDDKLEEYRTFYDLYRQRRKQISNVIRANKKIGIRGYLEAIQLARRELLK